MCHERKVCKPISSHNQSLTINKGKVDSTKVYFNGTGHEPTFVRSGDTLYKEIQFTGVFFTNKNGERLHGYLLKSRQAEPLNINIIHLRGAANNLVINFKPLIRQGLTILVFDYTGFGFSEGHATRKNLLDDGDAVI